MSITTLKVEAGRKTARKDEDAGPNGYQILLGMYGRQGSRYGDIEVATSGSGAVNVTP